MEGKRHFCYGAYGFLLKSAAIIPDGDLPAINVRTLYILHIAADRNFPGREGGLETVFEAVLDQWLDAHFRNGQAVQLRVRLDTVGKIVLVGELHEIQVIFGMAQLFYKGDGLLGGSDVAHHGGKFLAHESGHLTSVYFACSADAVQGIVKKMRVNLCLEGCQRSVAFPDLKLIVLLEGGL